MQVLQKWAVDWSKFPRRQDYGIISRRGSTISAIVIGLSSKYLGSPLGTVGTEIRVSEPVGNAPDLLHQHLLVIDFLFSFTTW